MEEEKYVKLKDVEELIKLIRNRDSYHDWTNTYEELDKKVNDTIERLKRNAIEL